MLQLMTLISCPANSTRRADPELHVACRLMIPFDNLFKWSVSVITSDVELFRSYTKGYFWHDAGRYTN
jgi:hypothetical protein